MYDEQPDGDSFDEVIRRYAAACTHGDRAGMREGYIKLRGMVTADALPPVGLDSMEQRVPYETPRVWMNDMGAAGLKLSFKPMGGAFEHFEYVFAAAPVPAVMAVPPVESAVRASLAVAPLDTAKGDA